MVQRLEFDSLIQIAQNYLSKNCLTWKYRWIFSIHAILTLLLVKKDTVEDVIEGSFVRQYKLS